MKILRKLCKLSLCAKSFPAGSLHAGIALVVTILLLTDSAKGQTSAARPPTKPTSKLTTNKRSFEIPFSIDASDQNIVEVVLHESQNGGRNWREYATKNPAAAKFQFECSQDGEYWFALQTTNRNGQKSPASRFRPELRIIVDTQQPLFEFEVRPDAAGRLVAQWTASDPNLDPNSLEISYQSQSMSTSPNATWIQVPTASPRTVQQGLYQDQLAWWPKTASRSIQVRALIRDHAGNATAVMRQTVVPQVAQQSVPVTVPKVAGTPPPTPAASSAVSNSLGARASSIKTNLNNKIKRVVGYQPLAFRPRCLICL